MNSENYILFPQVGIWKYVFITSHSSKKKSKLWRANFSKSFPKSWKHSWTPSQNTINWIYFSNLFSFSLERPPKNSYLQYRTKIKLWFCDRSNFYIKYQHFCVKIELWHFSSISCCVFSGLQLKTYLWDGFLLQFFNFYFLYFIGRVWEIVGKSTKLPFRQIFFHCKKYFSPTT